MAIDDIETFRSELPEAFKPGALPSDWERDWHVIEIADPDGLSEDDLWRDQQLDVGDLWERWTGNSEDVIAPTDPIGTDWPDTFPGRPRIWKGRQQPHGGSGPACPPPECFAFYLPFHFYYPDWWGVYLIAEGVLELASYIRWSASGQISMHEAVGVARLFLYAHESFHHLTEAFATRLEVTHRSPFFTTTFAQQYAKSYGTNACQEEALANAHALRTVKRALRKHPQSKLVQSALASYVEACPPGYSLGTRYIKESAFVEERCRFAELNQNLAVTRAAKKDSSIWRVFPQAFGGISRINSRVNYLVRRNSSLASRLSVDARYLTYRDLERKLKAAQCAFIRSGKGSHQIWQGPTGARAPIPNHRGDIHRGLLGGILKQLGLSIPLEAFLQL